MAIIVKRHLPPVLKSLVDLVQEFTKIEIFLTQKNKDRLFNMRIAIANLENELAEGEDYSKIDPLLMDAFNAVCKLEDDGRWLKFDKIMKAFVTVYAAFRYGSILTKKDVPVIEAVAATAAKEG